MAVSARAGHGTKVGARRDDNANWLPADTPGELRQAVHDNLARLGVSTLDVVVADRHGASPQQMALAWLLARSPSILLIPGTSSIEHLEQNVRAAEYRLTERDLAELERAS